MISKSYLFWNSLNFKKWLFFEEKLILFLPWIKGKPFMFFYQLVFQRCIFLFFQNPNCLQIKISREGNWVWNKVSTCGNSALVHFLLIAKKHISVLYSKSMYIKLHLNFILVYLVNEIFDKVDYFQKTILNVSKMCFCL